MSRFETKFAELAAKKEGAFVPFVTLCDPTFDRSFEIICTLVENGADALELGFPFSDPLLDGPVIQAANNRALNAGHSTEDSFKLLAKVRSKYPDIPISLLLCANLIFAKGLDNFYQRCAEVGVDAVLVADIPLLAKEDYIQAAKKHVLLVLDEVCASLSSGLLELVDIVDFLDHRPAGLEVVMTGRKPPEELLLRADYVTEMEKIKHPFDRKILARRGIEY